MCKNLNKLKQMDLFKQKVALMIGDAYSKDQKDKQVMFYGSWHGLFVTISILFVVLGLFANSINQMMNGHNDNFYS